MYLGRTHEELGDELLFCALARQLAYDCIGTPRGARAISRKRETLEMLGTLEAISIPIPHLDCHPNPYFRHDSYFYMSCLPPITVMTHYSSTSFIPGPYANFKAEKIS